MITIYLFDPVQRRVLVEVPPAHRALRWLYRSHWLARCSCALLARSSWIARIYAAWQRTRWSRRKILPFIHAYQIDTTEFLDSVDSFPHFAAFFERRLRSDARPIAAGDKVFVSPADGRLRMFSADETLFIKQDKLSLEQLLQDSQLAAHYQNGQVATLRLAPQDYHRLHAPLTSMLVKIHFLEGPLYSVSPLALRQKPGILGRNRRVVLDFGNYLLVLVGATFVGSIHLHIREGEKVEKGQEIAHFSFGGSMCVIVFPDKVCVNPDRLYPEGEVLFHMGEKLAEFPL